MLQVKVARYQGKENTTLTISKKNNPSINGYIELNIPVATSKEDEQARLLAKVKEVIGREDVEFVVKDFTTKDFASFSTKQIQDKLAKLGDTCLGAKEMMEAVLEERNATPAGEAKAEGATEGKIRKSKPKKAEGAPTGSQRELKKMLSDEEINAQLMEARSKAGQEVRFFCQKTQQNEKGVIKTARLDKRSNFIQYRIMITEGPNKGLIFGKGNDSMDIEFLGTEFKPEPKPAKEPKEAKPKATKATKTASKVYEAPAEEEEEPKEPETEQVPANGEEAE